MNCPWIAAIIEEEEEAELKKEFEAKMMKRIKREQMQQQINQQTYLSQTNGCMWRLSHKRVRNKEMQNK